MEKLKLEKEKLTKKMFVIIEDKNFPMKNLTL
jgi:hypothetical protein